MRIATFNINSVNRRLPNLLDWLAEPDVVCLQELKAVNPQFLCAAIEIAGYGAVWKRAAGLEWCRHPRARAEPVLTRAVLPGGPGDKDARYIEAAVNGVLIASL